MTFDISRFSGLSLAGLAAVAFGVCACGAKPAEDASKVDEGASSAPPADTASEPPPLPRKAPPPAPVETGPKTAYDKDAVEISLKRAARQVFANCGGTRDEQGKATGPWGKVTVTVQLGHNGHSQGATMGAPFSGSPVGKCIFNAFNNMIYPPFAGGDTTVSWEVESVKVVDAPVPKK